MRSRLLRLAAVAAVAAFHGTAHASLTLYLELPGVNGESDAPGRPDVTVLDSLSLEAGAFDATKRVDSTSPALAGAALSGTPYGSATLAFYDSVASDSQPDAELVLHTALVTGIQAVLLGSDPGETVSFAFTAPSLSLFLELPGVTGESSAPGHPGVIALDSIALSENGFSVRKSVDSTSPGLATALVLGAPYATASLLVYTDIGSETQPDFALVYQNALVSSIAIPPSQNVPKEDVAFSTAGVTVQPAPAPEPPALPLLAAGLVASCGAARASSRSRRGNAELSA